MIYDCCDERRRTAVAEHPTLNGIDYLEVLDGDAPAGSPPQQTLLLRLLKPVPAGLGEAQLLISGGERVRSIAVEWAEAATGASEATPAEQAYLSALPEADHVLAVRTDRSGDFSTYTLRLVRSAQDTIPPQGIDPQLAEVKFSFKVECPSDFDCRSTSACLPEPHSVPAIDYLAKDYPSFRRLILDRLSQLIPGWREQSAADVGVTLAELLAYVADQLSYQQDAVGTEAYLGTARLRTSVRRHSLLVDYHMHDGCNSRAWIHVEASAAEVQLPRAGTRFYSKTPGFLSRVVPESDAEIQLLRTRPVVFQPLDDSVLDAAHNEIFFYAWGDQRCCLPAGSTSATLAGNLTGLHEGDVLLFEEVVGLNTGRAGDADPAHRHVVRLTSVVNASPDDPTQPLTDPLTDEQITGISWAPEDALPFPLCVSSVTDAEHGKDPLDRVSVARGNMVLADHGYSIPSEEDLGSVRTPGLVYMGKTSDRCEEVPPDRVPPRYRPQLAEGPLTFAAAVPRPSGGRRPFDPDAPAAAATRWSLDATYPEIQLESTLDGVTEGWESRRDLLNSQSNARHFVVEVEHGGSAYLRFGDDTHGRRPEPGEAFTGAYRVGNGRAGNIGAGALAHVACTDGGVVAVRNPLPAIGGVDAEDVATVRRRAPEAFRYQQRAVTPEDYAAVTQRHPAVQRAAATVRWTGSWHTVFLTVDGFGGRRVDEDFERELTRHVERYRMAGHDTEFNDPIFVSLEIDLLVCIAPGYMRSDVKAGLLEVLGSRNLPGGGRGLFHPDGLTFGQVVYLSPIYAAARRVAGVASAEVTKFDRQGENDPSHLSAGLMPLSRLEIPRLDNDPNFPEHGVLRLNLVGGK